MTPFAALGHVDVEKKALAGAVTKGLGLVGRTLGRSGNAAKQVARRGVFNELGGSKAIASQADRLAMRDLTAGAAKGVGNKRIAMAGRVDNAAQAINKSPGIQKAINYGGGAALAGAGLYGANRMGYNSGVAEAGGNQASDNGMQAGIDNSAPLQTGYLQTMWHKLPTGVAYGDFSERRSNIMNTLMRSYAG